jgi:hypothetical protein
MLPATIYPGVFPSYVHHPPDSVSPFNFAFPTSSLAAAEPSITSTTGTPSLVSSSDPDYLSPTMMQNLSPRTPPLTLGSVSDVYEIGLPSFSIPLSPVSPDSSPWDMPNTVTVRNLSFILPSLVLTVSTISNLRNRSLSPHSTSANEAPWCPRSDTSPTPVTDVATLRRSNSSHVSTFICRSPTN